MITCNLACHYIVQTTQLAHAPLRILAKVSFFKAFHKLLLYCKELFSVSHTEETFSHGHSIHSMQGLKELAQFRIIINCKNQYAVVFQSFTSRKPKYIGPKLLYCWNQLNKGRKVLQICTLVNIWSGSWLTLQRHSTS